MIEFRDLSLQEGKGNDAPSWPFTDLSFHQVAHYTEDMYF